MSLMNEERSVLIQDDFFIFSGPTGRISYYHWFTSSHRRLFTFSTLIFSQTTELIENKLGMNCPWAVLHKVNLNHVIIIKN